MTWNASVTNKQLSDGILAISVQYSDGKRTVNETCKSSSASDSDWLATTITRRLEELDNLDKADVAIALGSIIPKSVVIDNDMAAYNSSLRQLENVYRLVPVGVLQQDDKKIIDLQNIVKIALAKVIDRL